jgi:hypothetical protein
MLCSANAGQAIAALLDHDAADCLQQRSFFPGTQQRSVAAAERTQRTLQTVSFILAGTELVHGSAFSTHIGSWTTLYSFLARPSPFARSVDCL